MSIEISGYVFSGPYTSSLSLEDRSGVYVVLTPTDSTHYRVLDVGESARVRTRVENHDRRSCWRRHANRGAICYAAYYMPGSQQSGRQAIEKKIRKQYKPPCGVR